MIDLTNTCVLVRTKEENEMLLKEAEKQEFHWYKKDHCEPLQTCLLYTSPSPRDLSTSRMPSSA